MKRFRKVVFIVAYKRKNSKIKYLTLKRKLHWTGWEFPKGGINSGENLIKTVKRELKEETGQTYILFSAELPDKKIKIDKNEHSSFKWTDYETALTLLTFSNKKRCLKILNKDLLNTFK